MEGETSSIVEVPSSLFIISVVFLLADFLHISLALSHTGRLDAYFISESIVCLILLNYVYVSLRLYFFFSSSV